jgi:hypothetical protein
MHNQHAGLSQALASQRITERHEQAAHARLLRGARPPRRRRTRWAARRWWQLAPWPHIATNQPAHHPTPHQLTDREATMSKLTRTLIIGAALAAMHLAGMTAVAHAQANDPDGKDARRQATERQTAETDRERPVSAQQTAAEATLRRVLARERFSIPSQTPDRPTAPAPPEPSGQPNWLVASLGGFAAGLALASGLALLAARRAGRRTRVGHAA